MKRINIPEAIRLRLEAGERVDMMLDWAIEGQKPFSRYECKWFTIKDLAFDGMVIGGLAGDSWPQSWLEDVEEDGPNPLGRLTEQFESMEPSEKFSKRTCDNCGVRYCRADPIPDDQDCSRWVWKEEQTHTLTPDELARVRVDAPLMVEQDNHSGACVPGHFHSMTDGGMVVIWPNGKTSHTTEANIACQYERAKIPQSHNPAQWRAENLEKK